MLKFKCRTFRWGDGGVYAELKQLWEDLSAGREALEIIHAAQLLSITGLRHELQTQFFFWIQTCSKKVHFGPAHDHPLKQTNKKKAERL